MISKIPMMTTPELIERGNEINKDVDRLNFEKTLIVTELNKRQKEFWESLEKYKLNPGGFTEEVMKRILGNHNV